MIPISMIYPVPGPTVSMTTANYGQLATVPQAISFNLLVAYLYRNTGTPGEHFMDQPSQPISVNAFSQCLFKIESLREWAKNMNVCTPNGIAVNGAKTVVYLANEIGLEPSRVSASAEGGVAVAFRNGHRFADIEVLNTGEISVLTSDGSGDVAAWEVNAADIKGTLGTIRSYTGL